MSNSLHKLLLGLLLTIYHTILTFNDPGRGVFEKIVGKGENAGNQHFLLFPQSFPHSQRLTD